MHSLDYGRYMAKGNFDKSIHILEGILKGIAIDSVITESEVRALNSWLKNHIDYSKKHPFNEIMFKVKEALKDNIIGLEEKEDLLWLCNNFHTDSIYYDAITSDIQRLHGILHGILADGEITDEEIRRLSDWMSENEHLKGCYPFDEIDSLLTTILSDGKIVEEERKLLKTFLEDFEVVGNIPKKKIGTQELSISGVCAVCPDIIFSEKSFCITGESKRATRTDIIKKIESIGGNVMRNIREDLNYLIICAEGNMCWAFSCYGRKVEKAVNYRKKGARIVIIHENDLWDAIEDNGA